MKHHWLLFLIRVDWVSLFLHQTAAVVTGFGCTEWVCVSVQEILVMGGLYDIWWKFFVLVVFIFVGLSCLKLLVFRLNWNQMFFSWGLPDSIQCLIHTLPSLCLVIFGFYLFINQVTILFKWESLVVINGYFNLSILCDKIIFIVKLFQARMLDYVLYFNSLLWIKLKTFYHQIEGLFRNVGNKLFLVHFLHVSQLTDDVCPTTPFQWTNFSLFWHSSPCKNSLHLINRRCSWKYWFTLENLSNQTSQTPNIDRLCVIGWSY